MLEFINIEDYKDKFANLINKLYYGAHIGLNNINEKVITSSFFDLFENNEIKLLDESPNQLVYKLFNGEITSETNKNNPIYWASIQYLNISLNKLIPLKQIFLLCPLKEMVANYKIYHEMNDIELVKEFVENNYHNRSILRELRNDKNLSIRELSILSDIPIETLKNYERSNTNLFNASNENIIKLANAMKVSLSFFYENSTFNPHYLFLIKDNIFINDLLDKIIKYMGIKNKEEVSDFDISILTINIKNKKKYLDKENVDVLFKQVLDRYIKNYKGINLLI